MFAVGNEPATGRATRVTRHQSEMAPKQRHPPGPAMTLGNMRELGVQRLIASCLNDACRHTALIDVFSYPADTEVPWFRTRVVCAKCGGRGTQIDVRPNWKEQPVQPSVTGKVWRRAILLDALFAIAFSVVTVTIAHFLFDML